MILLSSKVRIAFKERTPTEVGGVVICCPENVSFALRCLQRGRSSTRLTHAPVFEKRFGMWTYSLSSQWALDPAWPSCEAGGTPAGTPPWDQPQLRRNSLTLERGKGWSRLTSGSVREWEQATKRSRRASACLLWKPSVVMSSPIWTKVFPSTFSRPASAPSRSYSTSSGTCPAMLQNAKRVGGNEKRGQLSTTRRAFGELVERL